MSWVIELSRQHKPQAGQANLFGVIIYTNRHASVAKMLEDEHYWRALDELSGPRWAVFATRAVQGHYGHPDRKPGDTRLYIMREVWKEPGENRELLQTFGLTSTNNLPVLVVFAETPDGSLLRSTSRIDESSEELAYNSLKSIFTEIAESLDFMYDCNRREEARAFEVVEERLAHLKGWQRLRTVLAVFERMKALLS